MLVADIALVVGAYLLGSLPYMVLLARARGFDFSREPDLHMAVWHRMGRLEGISAIVIDILKGVIPVALGFIFDFRLVVIAIAGVAAVAGQMWPVFRRFDGEKGNTTGIGVILTLTIWLSLTSSPLAYIVLIAFVVPILIGAGIKSVPRLRAPGQTIHERFDFGGPAGNSMPLGMGTGFVLAPLSAWCLRQPIEMVLSFVAIFIIIIIRRLTAGLGADLRTASISVRSILLNRFLFDRSYR